MKRSFGTMRHFAGTLAGTSLIFATLTLMGGCGYKTPPAAPESVVPKAIEDLRYDIGDEGVRLTWSYPVETLRGRDLEDVSSFDLYIAEVPLESYCGSCPIPFSTPLEVPGGVVYDGDDRRHVTYNLNTLRSGHKYFFKVQSRLSWWAASSDSNIITFTWFQPAAAPADVTLQPGDRQLTLQWQPVTSLTDGRQVGDAIRYQIARSEEGGALEKLGEPVAAPRFVDREVRNGVHYGYTVQSLMVYQDQLVEGMVSDKVEGVPIDLTPPLAPTGVNVIETGSGNKIYWDANEDEDIGGYKVYRRPGSSTEYTLLGSVEPQYTIFEDRNVNEGERYYYAVTAFDKEASANESRKSREATVRY